MFLRFAKRTKVDQLRRGQSAVVEGTVGASSLLKLPRSETKCVFYDVLNESFRRGERGAGRKLWLPKSVEQKLTLFSIEDETGKVWVSAEGEEVELSGAPVEAGLIGNKGNARFTARFVKPGFVVRARGLIDEPRRGEPKTGLVLRSGAKGRLELMVRRS